MPCATSGDEAKPHIGTLAPESATMSRDQMAFPVAASRQFNRPAAPSVYSFPSKKVGVARAPAQR